MKIHAAGPAVYEWYFRSALARDGLINALILLILLVFFRVFFGTWRSGLYFALTLLLTVLAVFGGLALFGVPVDLLTNNLFLMSALAGAEDFLFVSVLMMRSSDSSSSLRVSLREMVLPGFFTSLTTALGFGSLGVSDLRMIRRFGYAAAGMAFVEWGAIFLFLPSFCSLAGGGAHWTDPDRALRFRIKLPRLRQRGAWIALSLLAFAGGCFGFAHLNYDDRVSRNFPAGHEYSSDLDFLRQSRGWEGMLYVQFDDVDSFPRPDPRIDRVLGAIGSDTNIAGMENPNELLRFATQGLSGGMAVSALGDIAESRAYKEYFSPDARARAVLYLKSSDLKDVQKTVSLIENACRDSGCRPVGESRVYLEYARKVSRTLFGSFAVSLLLVGAVLFLLGKGAGLKTRLSLLYSSFWGPVAMIGVMALLRTAINPVTSVFAAILVGLTGDNAIQYLFAGKTGGLETGMKKQASASVLLTALLMLCSVSFLSLTLVPLRTLGYLFLAGFALCLAGDLFLLGAILRSSAEAPAREMPRASDAPRGRP